MVALRSLEWKYRKQSRISWAQSKNFWLYEKCIESRVAPLGGARTKISRHSKLYR
ncbi:378_t:CDS:1, partial [Gigaspora rosea]